jgi:hypothetical protein
MTYARQQQQQRLLQAPPISHHRHPNPMLNEAPLMKLLMLDTLLSGYLSTGPIGCLISHRCHTLMILIMTMSPMKETK